jgi:hypothetical protein
MHDCLSEPDEYAERDHEVRSRRSVQQLRERPRNGTAVDQLNRHTAPDIVSNWVEEDFTL